MYTYTCTYLGSHILVGIEWDFTRIYPAIMEINSAAYPLVMTKRSGSHAPLSSILYL